MLLRIICLLILIVGMLALFACYGSNNVYNVEYNSMNVSKLYEGDELFLVINPINDEELIFNEQYNLLREFAAQQNEGSSLLSEIDILMIRRVFDTEASIFGMPGKGFIVVFQREYHIENRDLIERLLNYTGICEEYIYFVALSDLLVYNGSEDYLMGNKEYYAFISPYLRLREFASITNSNTNHYSEVIITSLVDRRISRNLMDPPITVKNLPSRFSIGFADESFLNDQHFINEMLTFAGLNREDVGLFVRPINNNYVRFEFLRVNSELAELARKWNNILELKKRSSVYNSAQELVFDMPIRSASAANRGFRNSNFEIGLACESLIENENLIKELLNFIGIERESIDFIITEGYVRFSNK